MEILVPTDFSESANLASEFALQLGQRLNTGVVFLHLVNTPVDWRKLPLEKEDLYPETRASIGDAKDKLVKLQRKADAAGVEAHTSLVFNTAVVELERYVKKENHFLVVMGTHGKKASHQVLGTNTLKVLQKSEVPVLVVKAGQHLALPGRWVIFSDFKEESRPGFEMLLSLAEKTDATVEILYVNTAYNFSETAEIDQRINSFMERHQDKEISRVVVNARNEEKGVEDYVNSAHCDLLAVALHRRSSINQIFARDLTARLIDRLQVPVISINDGH